jgi:hypothetical protein
MPELQKEGAMRFRSVALIAAGLAFVALGIPASAGTSVPSASIAKVGTRNGGGEPSLVTGPGGMLYASWPGDIMGFARSSNGGKSWTQGGQPADAGSVGDTSVNTDASGAVYETDLNVLNFPDNTQNSLQISLWKSFDKGATWPQEATGFLGASNASDQPFFVDRQWTDSWIPPHKTTSQAIVGLSYHDFVPSQIWVNMSTDGGKTFGPAVDAITSPQAEAASACSTIPGGLRIVPSGTHAGRIYVAWLAADVANPATGCNLTQLQAFHTVWVAWSDDLGQTWTDQLVYDAGPLHDGSEIFADLTLDNQGNPYVAFPMNIGNEYDMFVEYSLDGGKSWNGKSDGTGKPYQANTSTGTHYFAAIGAGKPGQVDVAFLYTPTVVTSLPDGKPDEPTSDADADWYIHMSQSTNLSTGKFTEVNLTPQSVHHGDVCTLGIFCAAVPGTNRDLLDFIDLAVDSHGLAHVAFTSVDGQMPEGIFAANQTGGPNVGAGGH